MEKGDVLSHYIIGDIHGCLDGLNALLNKIAPSSADKLSFVGDLVGKGPDDWNVLELIRSIPNAQIILGNWDLSFLKQHYAAMIEQRLSEEQMLCYALLQHASLAKWHVQTDTLLVHAGIWPGWSLREILSLASEVEAVLKDHDLLQGYVQNFSGNEDQWRAELTGWKRVRCIVNIFTRMRTLDDKMRMCFDYTGPVNSQLSTDGTNRRTPWYQWQEHWPCKQIIFGHWAMLKGETGRHDIINIDGGYVYGGSLIAINCETQERIVVKSQG